MRSLFLLLLATVISLLTMPVYGWQAAPAAPPERCDIQRSSWCISEGAFEITERQARDGVFDSIWRLRGTRRPNSVLVVKEPNGCKGVKGEKAMFLSFEHRYMWDGATWDRLRVRLRNDGTCDLDILMPAFDGDSLEWAYSSGLDLIAVCTDKECPGQSLGELKPAFESKFRSGWTSVGKVLQVPPVR